MEKPNHRHWLLLRQGREWPSDRTASNSPNEISPPHGCPPRPTRRYLRLKHSRGDDSSKGAITPLTMSALKADMCSAKRHVRFTPNSDIKCDTVECPLWPEANTASILCPLTRILTEVPPMSTTSTFLTRDFLTSAARSRRAAPRTLVRGDLASTAATRALE